MAEDSPDREDEEEEEEDELAESTQHSVLPNSQELFLTQTELPSQASSPDTEAVEATSSANFSSLPPPSQRLSQIRRWGEKKTREEMFSEITKVTRKERAHLNEWKDVVAKCRKDASDREDRRDQGNCFVPASEIIAVEETEIDEKQRSSGKWQKMAKPHAFTVTEHANHAKDNLFEVNIYKYDGIVCVGGDGMFSEVMHGLIGRIQKDSGIDQNNPKAPLVQCNMRIGIIPAGSTDCICYATVGVTDPVTSALHIIVGDSQPLDVSSIHHNNTFLKYSVSLLGYGFYGDILKDSEKKRWMGTIRYDFSGFKTFLSHHYYEGAVSFLLAKHTLGSPRDKKRCRTGCLICRQSKQQPEEPQKKYGLEHNEDEGGEDWKVIKGKFLAINAVNMSCACPRSPKGLSPAAHLADGSIDLILVRKCSRFNFLRYLVRHTNQDDQFDFTFVEVYRVKKFQFTSKHLEDSDNDVKDIGKKHFGQFCRDHPACCCNLSNSIWNCDGETLDSSTIEVRVHCQLMKLFARGIEENSNDEAIYNQSTVEQLL
ncbi:ceramide kinase isoform X3 [Chelonoidis abingdonii]|uniref:ceramide kinase isoform X3 n=1 Tax=Chelonoidis abingdonii TaxID=106734 RepID=UPI003F49571C